MTSPAPWMDPRLGQLLAGIANRIVVVGSVARGVRWPKDMDVLWDIDSGPAYQQIKRAIVRSGLTFISPFIKCWTFADYGWQVEIIGIHHGPDYRATRRWAIKQNIAGIDLWVARPVDAPKQKSSNLTVNDP